MYCVSFELYCVISVSAWITHMNPFISQFGGWDAALDIYFFDPPITSFGIILIALATNILLPTHANHSGLLSNRPVEGNNGPCIPPPIGVVLKDGAVLLPLLLFGVVECDGYG